VADLQCPAIVILAPAGAEVPARAAEVFTMDAAAGGAALRERVAELSDLHRGETICVVAPARAIAEALGLDDPVDSPVTVAVDSSGWTLAPSSS
jgi:hypothetical protein